MAEGRIDITRQIPKLSTSVIPEINDIAADGIDRGRPLHHIYIASPYLRCLYPQTENQKAINTQ